MNIISPHSGIPPKYDIFMHKFWNLWICSKNKDQSPVSTKCSSVPERHKTQCQYWLFIFFFFLAIPLSFQKIFGTLSFLIPPTTLTIILNSHQDPPSDSFLACEKTNFCTAVRWSSKTEVGSYHFFPQRKLLTPHVIHSESQYLYENQQVHT